MKIAYKIKRCVFKLFPQLMKSSDYVDWLKYHGVNVGIGTYFFAPSNTVIDIQRPWMLDIGRYCKITSGVTILCHDYSRSVLRRMYGDIVGEARKTHIGDNVFIGMNSIILMGSNIGNNVIIGAGSIVSGKIPNNVVIAGNPAKIICELDQYYEKRKNKMLEESFDYFFAFKDNFDRNPSISEMGPFFPIFLQRSREALKKNHILTKLSGDDEDQVINSFLVSEGVYRNYEEYIKEAYKYREKTHSEDLMRQ